ncbi:histidine kinase [Massilia sp. B-10]|nr:histidine kinase [Massilia sp. B-10]
MLEASAPLWRWRLFGLGLAVAGACLLVTQSLLSYWLFTEKPIFMSRVQLISTLYHVMIGLHVWACVVWLNPLLERLYPETLAPRMLFGQLLNFSGAILVTIVVYLNLFPYLMNHEVYPAGLYISAQRAILVALLINGWLLMRDFATAEDGRAARLQQQTDAMATDVDRSELAMLEAQIEPHFLFNTLAHIKRLYRIDDGSASEVLKNLIDYLERVA